MTNHIDTGKDMTYCDIHKYWRTTGTKCEDCETESSLKSVTEGLNKTKHN